MNNPHDVIIQPHISEQSMRAMEEDNWYTFKVADKANKPEIKKAIETIFDVKVEKVTTNKMPSKNRRMGYHEGTTTAWKKARIKLSSDDHIEIFEGM